LALWVNTDALSGLGDAADSPETHFHGASAKSAGQSGGSRSELGDATFAGYLTLFCSDFAADNEKAAPTQVGTAFH
jgi:hypothetical protein